MLVGGKVRRGVMRDCRLKAEEGGDDARPARPLCPGLHTWNNARYKGLPSRKAELIPKKRAQFGSGSATRPREAGIASNRKSAMFR